MIGAKPDAIISAAGYVNREWGYTGYRMTMVAGGYHGSVYFNVRSSDGSTFVVYADEWGNCSHGDTVQETEAAYLAQEETKQRIAQILNGEQTT